MARSLFLKKPMPYCLRQVSGKYFPDFVKLGGGVGTVGIRFETAAELVELEEALCHSSPDIDVSVNE
jgi:hypothetical protein